MLHLRMVSPGDCTERVVALLTGNPAVSSVVVLPGAGVQPAGDLVLADVAREEASHVLAALRPLDLEGRGSIAVEEVDVALSRAADRAEEAAPGAPEDAVVWEEVAARTDKEAALTGAYLTFLVVATMIAAMGIGADSPILIVGAMVVGPEFGPLAGLAVAAVQRQAAQARRSLVALAVGFPVAIGLTALAAAAVRAVGLLPPDLHSTARPLTGFIAQPGLRSVTVALLAGVAGMLSLTAAKSSALVGVLVSVTTVPAAAGVAVAAATADRADLVGSAGQLGLNLLALVVSALATLELQSRWQRHRQGT